MKKTLRKKFSIPIYFGDIIIYKTNDFSAMEKKFDFPENSMNGFGAVTFTNHIDGFTRYVMIFRYDYATIKDIAHECMHCLRYIYQDRGIRFVNDDNDEHQAYLMGYLVGECYNFLNKK